MAIIKVKDSRDCLHEGENRSDITLILTRYANETNLNEKYDEVNKLYRRTSANHHALNHLTYTMDMAKKDGNTELIAQTVIALISIRPELEEHFIDIINAFIMQTDDIENMNFIDEVRRIGAELNEDFGDCESCANFDEESK